MDHTVLIFAPLGRDAALTAEVLGRTKIDSFVCRDADELFARIAEGAGAVVLTEEALGPEVLERLDAALAAQPAWSSLPLTVLRSERRSKRASGRADAFTQRLGAYPGVVVLQRPLPVATLVSVIQAALAARQRQYQVRDLLSQLESLNCTLEARVAERTAVALRRAEELRTLSGELLLTEEREQRRFAELLHDDLQQLLMAATMNAQVLLLAKDPAKKDEIARSIADLLERSGKATRSLTVELSAPVLYERGLAAAFQWLAAEMSKQHQVKITVSAKTEDDPGAADVRVFLFRSVRELLLNAIKYGKGSPIHIAMDRNEKGALRVVVADEGPGFDPVALATREFGSGGFGLANIRQRAALLGGEMHIDSAPGRGTRMTLLAPLPAQAAMGQEPEHPKSSAAGPASPSRPKRKRPKASLT